MRAARFSGAVVFVSVVTPETTLRARLKVGAEVKLVFDPPTSAESSSSTPALRLRAILVSLSLKNLNQTSNLPPSSYSHQLPPE